MERKTRASRSRQPPIQCLASFFAALLLPPPPPPPPLCCFILCRTGDERKPWHGPTDWPIVVASICLILSFSLWRTREFPFRLWPLSSAILEGPNCQLHVSACIVAHTLLLLLSPSSVWRRSIRNRIGSLPALSPPPPYLCFPLYIYIYIILYKLGASLT